MGQSEEWSQVKTSGAALDLSQENNSQAGCGHGHGYFPVWQVKRRGGKENKWNTFFPKKANSMF